MRASIRDREALMEISPAALSAYARAAGWRRTESYGNHSDIYSAEERPEIILPRTQRLGDYAGIVSQLIEIFAKAAQKDEIALYRDLVTSDRDVIRIRTRESEDGSITAGDGVNLIRGAYDMLLAAACSLDNPQPLYRAGANKEANSFLSRVRLGQTEQSSFVVTLLTPVVPPPMQRASDPEWGLHDDPVERRVTKRLAGALTAIRQAAERTIRGDDDAFLRGVEQGVSANLCEALAGALEPFRTLDVVVTWARTRPATPVDEVFFFASGDVPILQEAARLLREREPQPDVRLIGVVQELRRNETETDGTVTIRTSIADRNQSVKAVLKQSDYERAILAHKEKTPVVVRGDLERTGQRWRLLNPCIVDVIAHEDEPSGEG